MSKRSRDWNEGLAKDLRNPEFAQAYLVALLDEGFGLQEALGKAIRAYGVREFATKAKLPSSNVVRSIDPRHNPTQKTLEQLLKPFKLSLAVAPMSKGRKRVA